MVLPGGRSYRKASQKGPRGGKTRQEIVADRIRSDRERLRRNNLAEVEFHATPLDSVRHAAPDDLAVYGVYKDGSKWVLTGMAASEIRERVSRDRTRYSEMKLLGRYVIHPYHGELRPEDGVEIKRFDTKADALDYVAADGSSKIRSGAYVVRPKHDPLRRREEVDQGDFSDFKHRARTYRE
jgi:hypothetical protein